MTRYNITVDGSGQGFATVQIQKRGTIIAIETALHTDDVPAVGALVTGQVILQRANAAELGITGIVPQTIDLLGTVTAVGGAAAGLASVTPLNVQHACAFPVELGDQIYVSSIAGGNIVGLIQFVVKD